MRTPVGILLLWSAVAASAAPVTLESRSQRHAMIVEVLGDSRYNVRVMDLQTNEILLARELTVVPSEVSADVRDLHITVRIGAAPYGITTTAEIEEGDMVVDSLHTVWSLTPHRARLHTPGALHVGGEVKAPGVIRRVDPVYPEAARRDRVSGIVIVEALIDKTGTVRDAVVLKGLPEGLSEAAISAVRQWTFQPPTLNGVPVDVIFNVTVNFKLDSAKNPA